MTPGHSLSRRAALCLSTSMFSLMLASGAAFAQSAGNIGSVDVQSGGGGGLPPISSPDAVGSKAPAGSAPAMAPSQGSLQSIEPVSIISDKVINDVIAPSSDYNEALKYTPGWVSSNVNGLFGDAKGGWRGFVDGQYNITFDGIPFGDQNDPTHHSAAYFPAAFLGGITVDRGPGPASQMGYATFGGTMALQSKAFTDEMGGNLTSGFGSFNTFSQTATFQTGLMLDGTTRALAQYVHNDTTGALELGKYAQDQFQGKVEKNFGDFKITLYVNYGTEEYNNVTSITWQQLQLYGKKYGAVNTDPRTQQYYGYNNSSKQTDMEYLKIEGDAHDVHVDNTLYTYSYWYPQLQNNGANQATLGPVGTTYTVGGVAIAGSSGSVTSVKVPNINGTTTKVNIIGVASTDVTGYVKNNDYRAYGDILKGAYDVDAGMASGQIRAGLWIEHADNTRLQEYVDYTTGQTYPALGNGLQESYKLDLTSHITSFHPFIEYEWHPLEGLSITPGFKYEVFDRDHDALVNQTTLQPINYTHSYAAPLPYLSVNYRLLENVSVYAQASQGFLAPTVSAYYVFNPAQGGIQPQTTNNFQAGAVYKSEKFAADFDAYRISASNFPIVSNLTTGQQIYVNAGTAVYQGLEAEGTYQIMKGFSAYGSAALMQSKFVEGPNNGLRTPDSANYTAVGGVVYDDGFMFGSLLQKFTGGYYGSSGQAANSATVNGSLNYVKPFNTTDLVVGFKTSALHDIGIGQNVKVRVGVTNILDHRNTAEIAGTPAGTSPATAGLTYSFLPGRMIFGSVGIDF